MFKYISEILSQFTKTQRVMALLMVLTTITIITIGPSYDVFDTLYKELLGVSSHELYHTWNVKSIRPIEMFPYDFSKENYSELGFIYEGVTTYMGDLFLLKSNVFS